MTITIEALRAQLAALMAENAKLKAESEPVPVRKPSVWTEEQRKAVAEKNRRQAGREELSPEEKALFDLQVKLMVLSCENENIKRTKRNGSNGWWV